MKEDMLCSIFSPQDILACCLKVMEKTGWRFFSFGHVIQEYPALTLTEITTLFPTPRHVVASLLLRAAPSVTDLPLEEPKAFFFEAFIQHFENLDPHRPLLREIFFHGWDGNLILLAIKIFQTLAPNFMDWMNTWYQELFPGGLWIAYTISFIFQGYGFYLWLSYPMDVVCFFFHQHIEKMMWALEKLHHLKPFPFPS